MKNLTKSDLVAGRQQIGFQSLYFNVIPRQVTTYFYKLMLIPFIDYMWDRGGLESRNRLLFSF